MLSGHCAVRVVPQRLFSAVLMLDRDELALPLGEYSVRAERMGLVQDENDDNASSEVR